jgi:diguanylate cyclase (GGDEF)-like protein
MHLFFPHILFFRCEQWRELACRLGKNATYEEVEHLRELIPPVSESKPICVISSFADPVFWEFWAEKNPNVVLFQFQTQILEPIHCMADILYPSTGNEELKMRIQFGILRMTERQNLLAHAQKMAKNQKIQLELNDRLLKVSVELKEAKERIEELSLTDALTKLKNRRFFEFQLPRDILQSHRYQTALSLFIMDIDNFKNINDTFGHQVGDTVLTKLGEIIQNCLRDTDWAARYGGEEFIVSLPMTGHSGALKTAERLRGRVEKELSHIPGECFTVSIGLVTLKGHLSKEEMIHRADTALYRAKKTGKNKVVFFNEAKKEFCEFASGAIESDPV